jgi:hypothetical protein
MTSGLVNGYDCYAGGMTRFLYAREVRVFDYPQFAATLRDRAASLATQAGLAIEHIAESHVRKEAVAATVLEARGEHPANYPGNSHVRAIISARCCNSSRIVCHVGDTPSAGRGRCDRERGGQAASRVRRRTRLCPAGRWSSSEFMTTR